MSKNGASILSVAVISVAIFTDEKSETLNISNNNTDIIAPVDAIATKPKLSFSEAFESLFHF